MNNERIRFLVELLGAVAGTAFRLADNSEDSGSPEEISVQRSDFGTLSAALDACDELPELDGDFVRDGWLRALDELRALLDTAPTVQCNTCSGTGDMHEPGQEPGSCARCEGTGRLPADHHYGEPSHWANLAGQTITADLKAYNLKSGGAPAAACAAYSIPLYRHQAAQPQGEPVAWRVTGRGGLTVTPEYPKWATGKCSEGLKVEALVVADQPKLAPVIAGSVLDSYDYAIADLNPESACTYVSNGELAQLVAAVRTLQVRQLTQPKAEPDRALVAEIVEFGFGLKEISWVGGKMPEVGTKLYICPDLPSILEMPYDLAQKTECELPARRLPNGHVVEGLHFPAPVTAPHAALLAYRVIFNDGESSKWEDGAPQSQDLYDVRDGVIRGVQCAYAQLPDKAATVPAEPILVEAVAVTRECDEDGLRLDWLVEGGIAALEHPGTMLLVAQGVLTNDSGNGYVYPARNPEDDE